MICLVTNEGNGRMVTTLPPVHIALMGIERLVPGMEDLALMLQLLPRSSTGQKMTVYTNLIRAPRQPHDPDGPQERHLILVDNGRQALRESPLSEALLCIRCGACLNVCPVFAEIGGHAYVNVRGQSSTYSGPIGSIVSPGLFGQSEFGHLARASSLCGACKDACPVDIDLPRLLLRVRAGGTTMNTRQVEKSIPLTVSLSVRLFTWIALESKRFTLALKLAGWLGKVASPGSEWLHLPAFTGWGYSKDLPRPAQRPFRERWVKGLAQKPSSLVDQGESKNVQKRSETIRAIDSPGEGDLIERFSTELLALNGNFTLCSLADLSEHLIAELQNQGLSSIISWDTNLFPHGLIDSIRLAGISVSNEFNSQVKAGISGVQAAIAETGTLVLPSGNGRPQFVSLIPEIHFGVLRASDIFPNLTQILQLPEVNQAAMTSLISGPSRTADIEMTLTIGVHGPRKVHVFCLEDE